MRGELVPIWRECWSCIWRPLARHASAPGDLFAELFREFASPPTPPAELPSPPAGAFDNAGELVVPEFIEMREAYKGARRSYEAQLAKYQEAVANRGAGLAFRQHIVESIQTERAAVTLLEEAFDVIDAFGVEALRNHYFVLVEKFLEKYSLRYDLRRPFTLQPTMTGIFAGLVVELRDITRQDAHLHSLMIEFEDAIRDLRGGATPNRIKTCIQKQVNLLEAMGGMCPNVTENTLGRICEQVGTWPHNKVKDAMKSLYGFASDYPGIRHGGNRRHAIRDIEMRDMVAMTVLLAGFAPYLSHQMNSDTVYRGL